MKSERIKLLVIFLLLTPLLHSNGQGYHLAVGQEYKLSQTFTQNTLAEATNVRGNVSLDIGSTLRIKVTGNVDSSGYFLDCQYTNLALSLFSPDMDIAISSETGSNRIEKYLNFLEEHTFKAFLTSWGEMTFIDNLDQHILSFYDRTETNSNEQDIIIRTIREAFGEEALKSFINLTLNVYCENSVVKCSKGVSYSFNAKPIVLHNTFYSQPEKEGIRRIQGIGSVEAQEDVMEYEGGTITTKLSGNQTYDHVYDAETGWLIKGNSKQKMYLLSVFNGNAELPEGLEVPSLTETEFSFKGEQIIDKK